MPDLSHTSSTALTARPARGLFARVYEIARTEARDAGARRGLPFSGMFCSDDYLPTQNTQAPGPRA